MLSAQETTLIWIIHTTSCLWCSTLLEKRNRWKSKCDASAVALWKCTPSVISLIFNESNDYFCALKTVYLIRAWREYGAFKANLSVLRLNLIQLMVRDQSYRFLALPLFVDSDTVFMNFSFSATSFGAINQLQKILFHFCLKK